ncbi:MAG: B12-binding domain-containing radical SAM protein [Desulfobulbus propionicus]|nr:MAG: B12-binding domain-containing radical SAM protein [Desulfobulbus propionicus]
MHQIILTTLNARYSHSAIGLRYLYANLGELTDSAVLLEFTNNDRVTEICEQLLAHSPRIIGIGVYIWNVSQVGQLVQLLKKVAPQVIVVLGGPEVTHLPHRVDLSSADHHIRGEAEHAFRILCKRLLSGATNIPQVIDAGPVDPNSLVSPYHLYTDSDIAHRVIYVEASRGCPFSCEFCLSSLERGVRRFALDGFLSELDQLWQRGARQFKFIDRTFNLGLKSVTTILDFFLARQPPYFLHFEVVPDHLPEALRSRLQRFSPGTIQLEVGIQTLQPHTAAVIRRRLNIDAIEKNLRFLDQETAVHMHVDLIIGLPGERLEEFADNLNRLVHITSSEIQLGILKKLSGTRINRHDREFGMIYSDEPPYEILASDLIPFALMQEMKRFARFWDLVYNSGNFTSTAVLLWPDQDVFTGFRRFAAWVYRQTTATWQISLNRLAELLFDYLVNDCGNPAKEVANSLAADLLRIPGRVLPASIRTHVTRLPTTTRSVPAGLGKRQKKRLYQAPSSSRTPAT